MRAMQVGPYAALPYHKESSPMSGFRSIAAGISLAVAMTACGGSESSETGAADADRTAATSDDTVSGGGINDDDRSAMMDSITAAGVDDATATCVVDTLAETLTPADFELIATAAVDADIPASVKDAAGAVAADCAAKVLGVPVPNSDTAVTATIEPATIESVTTVPEQTEGTSDDPIPLGTTAALPNGYDVVVNSFLPAADDAVASANEFNEPAPTGNQYVLVNLSVTYTGPDDKATPAFELSHRAVSDSGTSYDGTDCSAVVPEPAPLYDDLFAGSTVTGNVCLIVADTDATDLTLYFDTYDASFDTATYYFSLA
jgi:hypothetical protein